MKKPIAQFLLTAMLSFPAQALNLYEWQAIDPPTPPTQARFDVAGVKSPVKLSQFKGKVVLVNFWATWCTPCIEELPTLTDLQASHRSDGLVVLAMSVEQNPFSKVKQFIRQKRIRAPRLAYDGDGDFFTPFSNLGLPITYIFDRRGNAVYRYEGATDWTRKDHGAIIQGVLEKKL